ncbi:MAG TPA: 4Fe-4S binding protein [Firmicutes bacterium]|nr:4Fe-4S binding protein [Bacillota bacterium]
MKRRLWQTVSTILNNAFLPGYINITIYQGFLKGYCTPTLNCYACPGAFASCPIGTLQHFAARHQFPFFLVGFLGIVGTGVGRMACGWLCPFGFLQDMIKKLSRRVVTLPHWMTYFKYVSLVGIAILLPWFLKDPWFSKICPAGGIEGAIPWAAAGSSRSPDLAGLDVRSMIGWLFWTKMAILAAFLGAMVVIKRPFCRAFCPLGAIFSLFNRISLVRMRYDKTKCDNCGLCNRLCPVDLDVVRQLDSPECIKCLECTKCPRHAITVTVGYGS